MGFGILLIGVLLLIPIPFFGGVDLHPFAYGIAFTALLRLIPYEESFRYPKWTVIPLLPLCTAVSGIYLLRHFGISAASDRVLTVLEAAKQLLSFGFHSTLLLAMGRLCNAVERPDLGRKCRRNIVFVCIYFALMLLFNLPIPGILALRESFGRYLLLFDALWLALLLLVALRVFACYRWICPEGEEDLPKKEGRFERYLRRRREEKDALRAEYAKSRKKK